jgi:hypothetical protein
VYEFNACFDGCSHEYVMGSITLEDAKVEAETWFKDYYTMGLERAEKRVKFCEEMIRIFNKEI